VAEGRADVLFGYLFLVDPQASDVELTFPWNTVCNTFLVPRPERLKNFGAAFLPFKTTLSVRILTRFSPPDSSNTNKGKYVYVAPLQD
jgi:hypothetical protein